MIDPKSKKPILHGNLAKIDNEKDVFTCQSYRSHTEPEQYDFDTLPGSEDDLENARKSDNQ